MSSWYIITAFCFRIFQMAGIYREEVYSFKYGFLYLLIINNISQMVCYWMLLQHSSFLPTLFFLFRLQCISCIGFILLTSPNSLLCGLYQNFYASKLWFSYLSCKYFVASLLCLLCLMINTHPAFLIFLQPKCPYIISYSDWHY